MILIVKSGRILEKKLGEESFIDEMIEIDKNPEITDWISLVSKFNGDQRDPDYNVEIQGRKHFD